jgi:hypothetical protein
VREEDSANMFAASSPRMPRATIRGRIVMHILVLFALIRVIRGQILFVVGSHLPRRSPVPVTQEGDSLPALRSPDEAGGKLLLSFISSTSPERT